MSRVEYYLLISFFFSINKLFYLFYNFSVSDEGSLKKAPLSNLSDYTVVLKGIGDSLRDIVVFSSKRQNGSNPCGENNGGCRDLCLFDGFRPVCHCSFSVVDADGKSCKRK